MAEYTPKAVKSPENVDRIGFIIYTRFHGAPSLQDLQEVFLELL